MGASNVFYLRVFLVALVATLAASASALADSGTVRISFVKAGWVISGTVGSGTLTFRGRTYPLSIGGLSYGFTFGASQTNLPGRVRNIFRRRTSKASMAPAALGLRPFRGPQAIILMNQKGAVLELAGAQTGLVINLDLSGMADSRRLFDV